VPSIPTRIRNYFFTGVVVIAPTAVSVYLLYGAFAWVDGLLGGLLRHPRLGGIEIPGVGFVAVIAIILVTGFLASNYLGRRVVALWDRMLTRIPLLNTIYAATKQIGSALLGQERVGFREVVWVEFPRKGVYALAFTTGAAAGPAPAAGSAPSARKRFVPVFMPTTPNPTSGFLLFVPEDELRRVPISVEEAIKLVISGGLAAPGSEAAGQLGLPPAPPPA
jgi:uncharacterized membrane protein